MRYLATLMTFIGFSLIGGCHTADKSEADLKDSQQDHTGHMLGTPAIHGMLLIGNGPFYVSHLPMFHAPHDYQLILEVTMQKTSLMTGDVATLYTEDRRLTGEKVYTIVPERFALDELFVPNGGVAARTSFKADLVRGHFERGGQTILRDVDFTVRRIVYNRKLDANGAALPHLQYIVFGSGQELFGAHLIQRRPDFDHIVSLRVATGVDMEQQATALQRGGLFEILDRANNNAQALTNGEHAAGIIKTVGLDGAAEIDVLESYYLETGDLAL